MKKLKRFVISLFSLLLISGLAASPALARDGTSGSSGSGSNDSSEASSNTTSVKSESETEVETHAGQLTEQLKSDSAKDLSERKAQIKEHTQEERQKSCDARKTSLQKRMSNAVAQAQKHKAVFDKIYSRVKDFHDSRNLDVANYDALTAAVDTAQTNADVSIKALQDLDISVDCTSQTVASSVSTFQQAVKSTRDSLKDYRKAIVNLITAVKGASTSSDKTDDSNTNSTTNQ